MLIRKIEVQHFGKFKNKVILDGFGERFNVLVQDNESGKSTLFHAMRHLFMTNFQQENDHDLNSFVPWNTRGMYPQVAVDFETNNQLYRGIKHFSVKDSSESPLCELYVQKDNHFDKIMNGRDANKFLRQLVTMPQHNSTQKENDKDQSLVKLLWNIQDSSAWLGEKGKRFFPEVEGNLKEIIYQQIQKQTLTAEEKNFQKRLNDELKKYYGNEGKSDKITRSQDAEISRISNSIKETEELIESFKLKQKSHEDNIQQKEYFVQDISAIQERIDQHYQQIVKLNHNLETIDSRLKNFEQLKQQVETLRVKKEQLEKAVFARGNSQSEIQQAESHLAKFKHEQHELQRHFDELEEQKSLLKEYRYQFEALKGLYHSYKILNEDYEKYLTLEANLVDFKRNQEASVTLQEHFQKREKALKLLAYEIQELESNQQKIDLYQANLEQYRSKLEMIQKDHDRLQEIKKQELSHDNENKVLMNHLQELIQKRMKLEKQHKNSEFVHRDSVLVYETINKLTEELQELKYSLNSMTKIQEVSNRIDQNEQKLMLLPRISTNDFEEIKRLDREIHKLSGTVEKQSTVITLCFDDSRQISYDSGQELFLPAKQTLKLNFSKSSTLHIQGVGEITIEPTNQKLHQNSTMLEKYDYDLARLFKLYNINSVEEASSILEQRQTLQNAIQADTTLLKNLLGDFENIAGLHEFNYQLIQDIQVLAQKGQFVIRENQLQTVDQVQQQLDEVAKKSDQLQTLLDEATQYTDSTISAIRQLNEEITQTQHKQELLKQSIAKNKEDEMAIIQHYQSEMKLEAMLKEYQLQSIESEQRLNSFLKLTDSVDELDEKRLKLEKDTLELQQDTENYQLDLGKMNASIERCEQEIQDILNRYEHDFKTLYKSHFDAKIAFEHEEQRIQKLIPWYQTVDTTDELFDSRMNLNHNELDKSQAELNQIQQKMNEYQNVINYHKGILESLATTQSDDETMLRSQFDMVESQYHSVLAKYQRDEADYPNLQNQRQHLDAEITRYRNSIKELEDQKREKDQQLHRIDGIIEAQSNIYNQIDEAEEKLIFYRAKYDQLYTKAKSLKLLQELFNQKSQQFDDITIEKISERTTSMWNHVKFADSHRIAEKIDFNDKFIPNLTPEDLIGNGLSSEQSVAHIERFSAGAIEQINILTRLSLIQDLIQAHKERHLLVLDDVLVYSDYERMKRVLELIQKYTDKNYLQVVILTCQKDHYERIFDRLNVEPQWLSIQRS